MMESFQHLINFHKTGAWKVKMVLELVNCVNLSDSWEWYRLIDGRAYIMSLHIVWLFIY